MTHKIGDKVKIYKHGLILKNKQLPKDVRPSWTREIHFNPKIVSVIIVLLGLRVPLMWNRLNQQYRDGKEDEMIYLDTMVQDENGDLWLTNLEFLEEKDEQEKDLTSGESIGAA